MLQVWKSIHPLNEYAPTWNIPFWNAVYPNPEEIDFIRNWLIDNEEKLIKTLKKDSDGGDGGTGLGENSLTAQYSAYNLFQITQNIPQFMNLLNWIREQYIEYMNSNSTTVRNLYMFSWANVVHKGQPITQHGHGAQNFSYLSGNIHLDNYDTQTVYYCPVDEQVKVGFENVKGGHTFFPSYVLHSVPEHKQDNKRVSIAFDLFDHGFAPLEDLDKAIQLKTVGY